MLKIENLHAYYGSIEALKGITLEVPDGKLCCIIGANGAGKTTLLKAISNVVQKTAKSYWTEKIFLMRPPERLRESM